MILIMILAVLLGFSEPRMRGDDPYIKIPKSAPRK